MRDYGDRWWEEDKPADLEKTNTASAAVASQTSKDSYTKKISLPLVKGKQYKFFFTYYHQDPDTQEVKESDRSPVWTESFTIPNLTKSVQNLTLTAGSQSYGVKFTLDPLSVQEDVIIFESLTSDFATQTIVYTGTSTNVSILTTGPNAFAPRWVKVRSRDKWDDLNISEATAGPVTPFSADVDTTVIPGAPTSVLVSAFNETSDPSNFTGYINVSWTAPATGAKAYNIGIWESTPGSTLPNREFRVEGTFSKIDGLFVGKSYYVQVKALSAFSTPSAWVPPSLNYPVVIPGNTAVPGAVTISGVGTPRSIVLSWTVPASNANLVISGGYYIAKIYTNQFGTGSPLETKTCFSNSATFAGLTTGTQYWVTIQAYTAGATPVAGALSLVYGPLIPIAVEPPDIQADFILANNQFQVGGTSGANDVHLSAYPKTVGGLLTNGRIYIGGPETSGSAAVGLYNSNGTPFYADNLGRFSLGDKLTWSGSALNVIGTIDVTGASTFSSYVIAGATNSTFIGIGKQVPYRISSALQSGANGLTGIVINKSGTVSDSDYIKSDGTFRLGEGGFTFNGSLLSLIGNVEATGGKFTGNVQLAIPAGATTSGTLYAGANPTSGARVRFSSEGIFAYDATSTDNATGQTFSLVQSTGRLNANLGTVGGWTLATTGLSATGTKIESNGTITLGDTTGTLGSIVRLSATDPFRIWVGSQSSSNAAFKVSSSGVLTATGATITGNVQITSGSTYDSIVAAQQAAAAASSTAGTANTNATAALTTANGKNSIFRQGSTPSALKAGDIWINFNDENKLYVAEAAGTANWVLSRDASIASAVAKADDALAKAAAAVTTANNAYPASNFSKSAILQAINASTNGATLNGGVLEAGTVVADNVVSTYVYAGYINADKINAGMITGVDIDISTDSSTGRFKTSYPRTGSIDPAVITSTALNAVAFVSVSTSGWVSSCYPYWSGGSDLGTSSYRWRRLMLDNGIYGSKSDSYLDLGVNTTRLYSDGRIFANTLGVGTGTTLVQSSGFIRVSSSSRRYKENIQPITGESLGLINMLQPVTFSYKPEFSKVEINPTTPGLIAEDVHEIEKLRGVVNYNENQEPESISYERLSVFLAMAIKELSTKVDSLSTRLDALGA